MAAEFTHQSKTFYNHIQKHEFLKTEIKQRFTISNKGYSFFPNLCYFNKNFNITNNAD
jgi:hypothetical protein